MSKKASSKPSAKPAAKPASKPAAKPVQKPSEKDRSERIQIEETGRIGNKQGSGDSMKPPKGK